MEMNGLIVQNELEKYLRNQGCFTL